jgi:hypothetical protein
LKEEDGMKMISESVRLELLARYRPQNDGDFKNLLLKWLKGFIKD